jgi:hypothetical protein
LSADDPSQTQTEEQLETQRLARLQWRSDVADALNNAGRWKEALNFRQCGEFHGNFNVLVCADDADHEAHGLPYTCHLRWCDRCERAHSMRLVAKYTPALRALAANRKRRLWRLKKIILTTKFSIDDPDAPALYRLAWEQLETMLQMMFQWLLKGEMTAEELERGRLDYKPHDVGGLAAAEFGERGKKLHFHMIFMCPWIDQDKLSELWKEATGGSAYVTYISEIKIVDVFDAVQEQVKYVTKFQQLEPSQVVKLAAILEGTHRMRVYGTLRGAKGEELKPRLCKECNTQLKIMRVFDYLELAEKNNFDPQADILAAVSDLYLQYKRGKFSGEGFEHLPRSDPEPPPAAAELPGFDAVARKKQPFQYQ